MNFISIVTIISFTLYIFMFKADKFSDVVPSHWYYYRTSIRQIMPSA